MSDDYESRQEQRREEERRYQSDVAYDVWRSGGNMDRVDRDRVSDAFHSGVDQFSAADREVRAQRPKPQIEEESQYLEENQE
jgi:hypothetical protein